MGFHCSPVSLSLAPFLDWQCDAMLGTCHVYRCKQDMPFTRCSWVFRYSTQQLLYKCKMTQNVCKNRAEDLPWLSQGMQSTGTLCWKFFFPWSFICQAPQHGMYSALSLLEQAKLGAVLQRLFFLKKIALGTHTQKNPIPCWINEGSPRTAIICMLSLFSAVAGENNSMPACCPEICCAKANSCSKWQAEKAPRYLMDECSSPRQRGTFVRS